MNIEEIQVELKRENLDGWLFFDHHQRDDLAYRVLGFAPARHVTRRWYYFIPADGEPQGLVHNIEAGMLDPLPGAKVRYSSWLEQVDGLRRLVGARRRVAMQYSPQCAIPVISLVDAGTVELVRSLGVAVVSSADLIQRFEARLNAVALESHLEAGRRVDRVLRQAFAMVGERLRDGSAVSEYETQQFIRSGFETAELFTDHGPIVGVNANASNPHYEPSAQVSTTIQKGDFLLIDLWAKQTQPGSVYYDITWTGVCGEPTAEMRNVFAIVRGARDAAIERVQKAVAAAEELRGFEVDDTTRGYIAERGFGEYFVHRTGHSIGENVHGAGANMDNLETHDERRIIPWTCFSIEPGIYLPKFGVRSEVNMFVGDNEARVTGSIQKELVEI